MQQGIYNLIIDLDDDKRIRIGKLGLFALKKGCYVYTGSAQNALQKRIARHYARKKRLHWHIDYLLQHGRITDVNTFELTSEYECRLSNMIGASTDAELPVTGFGSSDCRCKTHLYFFKTTPTSMLTQIARRLR